MPDALLDRIAAAKDLAELDSVRVSLLGKSGEITARLKSRFGGAVTPRATSMPRGRNLSLPSRKYCVLALSTAVTWAPLRRSSSQAA